MKVPWVFLGYIIFEILDSYSRLVSFGFHGLSVNGPNILNLETESLSPIDTIYLPLEIHSDIRIALRDAEYSPWPLTFLFSFIVPSFQ